MMYKLTVACYKLNQNVKFQKMQKWENGENVFVSTSGMNWSNLPFHITEKIIKYAAECKNDCEKSCCWNEILLSKKSWLMKLHKYGQVCYGWKEVFFHSKLLFHKKFIK